MATSALMIQYMGDVAVVNVTSSSLIDGRAIDQMRDELNTLVDKKAHYRLVLDLAKVRLLSSTALGVLIPLQQKINKERNGKLILCGVRPEIREVFRITKLEKMFRFCDDEGEAMSKMGVKYPA